MAASDTPRPLQAGDTVCYDFTVDSMGHRTMTNYPRYEDDPPADPPSGCW